MLSFEGGNGREFVNNYIAIPQNTEESSFEFLLQENVGQKT